MKLLRHQQQQHQPQPPSNASSPHSLSATTTTATAATATTNKPPPSPTSLLLLPHSPLLYEPTSVLEVPHHLDYLLSSTSPDTLLDLPQLPLPSWDPPPQAQPITSSSTTTSWDPLASFLSDPLPVLPPTTTPPLDPSLLLHNLLRAALALDSGDRDLSLGILTALHPHLPSPSGHPLQRSAFYFKDALHSLLLHGGDVNVNNCLTTSPLDLVGKIAAHRALHDLSPVPRFTSFTANQAILDALPPASQPLHLVDFDLGLGGHWSSLLRDLAARASPPAYVRLTAVVPPGEASSVEAALAAENLRDFAGELGVRLSVEVVGGIAGVRVFAGEAVAVAFTPWVGEGAFAGFVKGVGARVAVMVDGEPWWWGVGEEAGMRGRVAAGVEWYAAAMEAVEAAAAAGGEEEEVVGRVEGALVAGKVAAAVARGSSVAAGRGRWWWEAMEAAGMRPAPMSDFTEAQARWLAGVAAAAGYQVPRRDGGLMLTWQGIDLAATYAWRRC